MTDSELSLPAPTPATVPAPVRALGRIRSPSSTAPVSENPFGQPPAGPRRAARSLRKRIGSALAAIVALFAKFFAAIKALLLLLPKIKLLTTAGTALVSVAAYALFWGWTFAVGFVVLLFVHEMGHVIALRREGIKASAPMFIPFLGAVIFAKSLGDNALAEARVGLAGPILGTLGPSCASSIGEATDSDMFRALAYIGFFLNLFNLLPVVPLDGGRAMAAMAPWMWFWASARWWRLLLLFPQPDPADHRAVRRHGDLAPLAAAQHALARAGRLLPRRSARTAARGRCLHRADRGAGVRHARQSHILHRSSGHSFRSYLALSAALRARPVPCRAWSRARGSSGACRRGPCRGRARSRPWRAAPEK